MIADKCGPELVKESSEILTSFAKIRVIRVQRIAELISHSNFGGAQTPGDNHQRLATVKNSMKITHAKAQRRDGCRLPNSLRASRLCVDISKGRTGGTLANQIARIWLQDNYNWRPRKQLNT